MKTPHEIIATLEVCGYGLHGRLLFDDTEVIKAMKEYAKQWVDRTEKELNTTPRWDACVAWLKQEIDAQ